MKHIEQFFFGFGDFILSEYKVKYFVTSLGLNVHYFTYAYYRSCLLVLLSSFFDGLISVRPFSTIFLEFLFIDGANGIFFITFCLSIWTFSLYFLDNLFLTFCGPVLLEIHSIVVSQAWAHVKNCSISHFSGFWECVPTNSFVLIGQKRELGTRAELVVERVEGPKRDGIRKSCWGIAKSCQRESKVFLGWYWVRCCC